MYAALAARPAQSRINSTLVSLLSGHGGSAPWKKRKMSYSLRTKFLICTSTENRSPPARLARPFSLGFSSRMFEPFEQSNPGTSRVRRTNRDRSSVGLVPVVRGPEAWTFHPKKNSSCKTLFPAIAILSEDFHRMSIPLLMKWSINWKSTRYHSDFSSSWIKREEYVYSK